MKQPKRSPTIPQPTAQKSRTVRVYPGNLTVEAAPNQTVVPVDPALCERVGLLHLLPQGDGTFKPVAKLHEVWMPMTNNIGEKLGVGLSYETIMRLGRAGFIEIFQPTPRIYEINVKSLFDHIDKCKADPEFWTGENLKRYRDAL